MTTNEIAKILSKNPNLKELIQTASELSPEMQERLLPALADYLKTGSLAGVVKVAPYLVYEAIDNTDQGLRPNWKLAGFFASEEAAEDFVDRQDHENHLYTIECREG